MAISALDASKLIDGGNFSSLDLEELYTALSSDDKYSAQLEKLRSVMEGKLKSDVEAMSKIANVAEAVAKLDENTNPLDDKNADFATVRNGLGNLSFDSSSDKTQYNDIVKNIVAAAKLETAAELRGLSSPESPESKTFYAADETKRKQIYNETLSKNVELAVLTMALGEEVAKSIVSLNKEAANKADLEKKVEDFKKTLVDDVAKKFDAVSKFGKPDMPKIELKEASVIAYCANAEQKAVACLKEYGESVQKLGVKIADGFDKLVSDSSKQLKQTWDKSKEEVSKKIETASKNVDKGIVSFGNGCKKVWGKSYEVASAAAKKAWESRYEIAADAAAAAAFGLTVGTGGAAAVVGGIGYGVYTLGRRVVYEAYKAKKLNPEKSYKEIYKDPKFITKGIFAVAAAGISGSIGISAGLDTAADIVAQKLARRSATVLGSVTSGMVGVINAKDKEDRKKEWKSLGISTAAGIGGLLLGEFFGSKAAVNQTENVVVASKPAANAGDWKWKTDPFAPEQTPINEQEGVTVPYAPGYTQPEVEAAVDTDGAIPEFEFKDFPSEYNSEMGITKAQFINLRKIILKNGDEAQLNRLYSNATRFAQSVSVEGGKTLTAEEVLFKFTRAAAWTTKMDKDFWSQSQTGAFGSELTALKKMLECGDVIVVQETLLRARAVLDAVNSNGSLNANKSFNLVSELSKYNEVNAKGEIVGKTNNILVGMGTKNCDPEQKNFQFAKGGAPKVKVVEVAKTPEPELPKANPPLSPTPIKLEVPTARIPETPVAEPEVAPVVAPASKIALGAKANFSETPGKEGVNSIGALDPSKSPDAITAGQASASKDMLKDLRKSGKITDDQYNQGIELLKVAKKAKTR